MRLAWFSPLPPVRSGVSAYTVDVLAGLDRAFLVDAYVDGATPGARIFSAHDFAWRNRLEPYDLVVYQLGNAPCHDYMWAYLARYPGLVVLHDARLHHARARSLLSRHGAEAYRAELRFDHPDAPPDVAEYAVEGLGGPIAYFWSMLRVVMSTARLIAVHNPRVAADLRESYPGTEVETIRMGVRDVPASRSEEDAARVRREWAIPDGAVVFTAFGKITAVKRIGPIVRAFGRVVEEGVDAYLLLVGDADGYPALGQDASGVDRVRVTGYVADDRIDAYLAASDVCLCLRWPAAQETSASWLRCLAAGRPTAITDLAHLVDIPTFDPRGWRRTRPAREPIAVSIDLLEEETSLIAAMRRLSIDRALREQLGRAGHQYWSREHTLNVMVADYGRVIQSAAARSAPVPAGLPAHVTDTYSENARRIAHRVGADLDMLE